MTAPTYCRANARADHCSDRCANLSAAHGRFRSECVLSRVAEQLFSRHFAIRIGQRIRSHANDNGRPGTGHSRTAES